MQGYMCRIPTLGGKSPPGKKGRSSCEGYKKWLCMARHETSLGYWLKHNVRGASINLNKTGKAHDNASTTWYKGVWGIMASIRSRGVWVSCEMSSLVQVINFATEKTWQYPRKSVDISTSKCFFSHGNFFIAIATTPNFPLIQGQCSITIYMSKSSL